MNKLINDSFLLPTYVIAEVITAVAYPSSQRLPVIRKTPKMPLVLDTIRGYASYMLGVQKAEYPDAQKWSIELTWINPNGTDGFIRKIVTSGNTQQSVKWDTNLAPLD